MNINNSFSAFYCVIHERQLWLPGSNPFRRGHHNGRVCRCWNRYQLAVLRGSVQIAGNPESKIVKNKKGDRLSI